jgi:hypothetical protein
LEMHLGSWSTLYGSHWDHIILKDAELNSKSTCERIIVIASLVQALEANCYLE